MFAECDNLVDEDRPACDKMGGRNPGGTSGIHMEDRVEAREWTYEGFQETVPEEYSVAESQV